MFVEVYNTCARSLALSPSSPDKCEASCDIIVASSTPNSTSARSRRTIVAFSSTKLKLVLDSVRILYEYVPGIRILLTPNCRKCSNQGM